MNPACFSDYSRPVKSLAVFTVVAFWGITCASAHHATAAEYNVSEIVTMKGSISRVEWTNPHIHVYMDVKLTDGSVETWKVEFPAPGAAVVAGLSKALLAPGTAITFEGYLAKAPKDQSKPPHSACAKAITLSDGSRFGFTVGI